MDIIGQAEVREAHAVAWYSGGLWGLEHPPVLPDNHETNQLSVVYWSS